MDNFLLKRPNVNKPITNLNKRKPIAGWFWKKNESSVTSLSHQLAEVQGKILDKSIPPRY